MGTLNKNINFVWFGDSCDSCQDYSFYSGNSITGEFNNVVSVIDVKSGGYVYSGWSRDVHLKNEKEYETLPDLVKNTLGSEFLKNGQSFDKFECGRAYIVEIDEGTEVNIDGLFSANINENTTHRLVNPCPTCEGEQECDCKKIPFIFKNFDTTGESYEGWDDPQVACFDNQSGLVYDMVIDTTTPDVGTKLYLAEKIANEQFSEGNYITDNFTIDNQYIFSDNKIYLINDRTIIEVVDCDDIKRTPTPTLILDPPIENFCIRYSSVEKNNGTYRLQPNEHNNRPVWKTDSNMYAYYENPVGVSGMRWMISNQLGGKYGRSADTTGEAGPYDVSWESNANYYHTLVRGTCEETDEFWIKRGCVDGERPNMKAGDSVAINNDGTILAVGAKLNSDTGQFAGHVRVYRYESLEWSQMGDDIDGGGVGNFSGHALSLNEDGSILAIGAYNASRSPFQEESTDKNIGEVRIFKWNVTTNAWDSHGNVLYGNTQGARFGISCQLNPTGDVLVVGSSAATENITFNEEMPTPEKTPTPMPSGFDCTQDPIPDCIRIEDGFVDGYQYTTPNGGISIIVPDELTEYSKWNNTELILDNNAIDDLFMGQWNNITQAGLLGGENLFYRSKEPIYQDEFDAMPFKNSIGPSYLVLFCQPVTYLDENAKNYFNNCRVYEYSLWWTHITTNSTGPNAPQDVVHAFQLGNTRTTGGGKWVSVSPQHTSVTQQQACKIKNSGEFITDSSFYKHPVWTLDSDSNDTWPGLNIFDLPSKYTVEEYPDLHFMRNLEFVECQSDETTIQTNENFSDDIKETSIASGDSHIPTGAVEVYNFENGNWNQLGQTIYGEHNSGFGTATCISSLSTKTDITIAAAGDKIGEVYRYNHEKDEFIKKGLRIELPSNTAVAGTYDAMNAPSSISIAKYGDRIALGIPNIINENSASGYTQVYQYNGISSWSQLGTTLTGDVTSLKLSDEGTTLAYSDINYTIDASTDTSDVLRPGAVLVYQLEDNSWVQFGTTLLGKTHEDQFGTALDFTLFNNKVIIAVSSPIHTQYSHTKPILLGQTCVFESPPELNEEIPTPVDCVYTQTSWSMCSQPCDPDGSGPGVQTRTTTIISEPINGGLECPGTTIIQTCGEDRCPIDCEVSAWNWSGVCSNECGGGTETAIRTILQPAQFGGVACPSDLSISRPCNTHVCPKDCVGSWVAVTDCSKPCGGGTKTMAYQVTEPAIGTGLCPDLGKTRQDDCNVQGCPVDCVGDWSDWSSCTASCDGGKQTRSFIVSEIERDGGVCPNKNKIETRDCNTHGCPRNCSGYFDSWTDCSSSCGGGIQTRTFVVQNKELNGGTCENRGKVLTQNCNEQNCPKDCVGHWSEYGVCSKECGSGIKTRTFIVDEVETDGGSCHERGRVQSTSCNTQSCPVDCEGYWNSWSSCSKTCGGGVQTRNYIVRNVERWGGVCPDKGKTESRTCNSQACPTNCQGRWSSWSSCSKSCGSGIQTREYIVDVDELNGGTCVLRGKTESRSCNTQCCKQNCEGYWTEWGFNNVVGRCSKCETGQQTRKWVTTTPQSCGGTCDHYHGKTEYRNPGEGVCGCCPKNCTTGWVDGPCISEGDMNPKDNIQYIKSTFEITTPAECGGKCNGSQHIGKTKYEIGKECTGGPVASYKITGFGGNVGDEIEDLTFYPVLWAGNGRGSAVPDLNPNNSGNKVVKGPPNGWYAYQCQSYADTSGGDTPCRGNRKLSFRTPVWSEGLSSYYYALQWGYSAGKVGAYNQIWNGGFTGYRDWQIRNFNGSYRTISSQYGWVLFKMYKRAATYYRTPFGSGVIPGTDWGILTMYGWSYQPDPNNIPGLNSPMPVDGEQLVARNYKWGLNRNPDYLNRYDESYTKIGFNNIFGTIEKVKTLGWGKGLVATRPHSSYNMVYTLTE